VHEGRNPRSDETGAECSSSPAGNDGSVHRSDNHHDAQVTTLLIPWIKKPSKLPREIIRPSDHISRHDQRPIRAETRAKLVAAIATGRLWLDQIVARNTFDVEQIAKRKNCSIRQVNMTISLAFLAPSLVQAAVDGRLPRGIGVANLRDAPAEWSQQLSMLGLSS